FRIAAGLLLQLIEGSGIDVEAVHLDQKLVVMADRPGIQLPCGLGHHPLWLQHPVKTIPVPFRVRLACGQSGHPPFPASPFAIARNMPIAKKQRRPDVSSRKTKRCAEYSAHLCLCMSSSPIWKLRHGRRPERQKEKGSAPKTPNGGAALRPGLQAERNVLHSGRKERRKKAASRRWARRFPSQGPVGTALHESYFTRRSNPHFCSLYCSV